MKKEINHNKKNNTMEDLALFVLKWLLPVLGGLLITFFLSLAIPQLNFATIFLWRTFHVMLLTMASCLLVFASFALLLLQMPITLFYIKLSAIFIDNNIVEKLNPPGDTFNEPLISFMLIPEFAIWLLLHLLFMWIATTIFSSRKKEPVVLLDSDKILRGIFRVFIVVLYWIALVYALIITIILLAPFPLFLSFFPYELYKAIYLTQPVDFTRMALSILLFTFSIFYFPKVGSKILKGLRGELVSNNNDEDYEPVEISENYINNG